MSEDVIVINGQHRLAALSEVVSDLAQEAAESLTTPTVYLFRDIREFVTRRSYFLVGDGPNHLLTKDEYEAIRAGDLTLSPLRAALIRAFIRGYLCAKS